MTDLTSLTLTQAREALRKKEFSATELAEAHIAAVERARALNAFVVEAPERARAMARASDRRLAKGEAGRLEGLPLAIKGESGNPPSGPAHASTHRPTAAP